MDPISIAILVIAGLAYAINYIAQEIELKDKVINLAELVGVVCYAEKFAQGFRVYDFSSSHLCPKQLALIKEHLNAIVDKRTGC